MRRPKYRLRKVGGQVRKDLTLQKNQQRMGPLTIEARRFFLDQILSIQSQVNAEAEKFSRPKIDILNVDEVCRIRELHDLNTWPNGWSGEEPVADTPIDKVYFDGSSMETLFK
jgi:DNA sulfur modification protein DndC